MPEVWPAARIGRRGHRLFGGLVLGLLLLTLARPDPDGAKESMRLALLCLPAVVAFAVLRAWKQDLPAAWVLLHLHLMLLGLLSALAALRFGSTPAAAAAGGLLLVGWAAGWAAGRRGR